MRYIYILLTFKIFYKLLYKNIIFKFYLQKDKNIKYLTYKKNKINLLIYIIYIIIQYLCSSNY